MGKIKQPPGKQQVPDGAAAVAANTTAGTPSKEKKKKKKAGKPKAPASEETPLQENEPEWTTVEDSKAVSDQEARLKELAGAEGTPQSSSEDGWSVVDAPKAGTEGEGEGTLSDVPTVEDVGSSSTETPSAAQVDAILSTLDGASQSAEGGDGAAAPHNEEGTAPSEMPDLFGSSDAGNTGGAQNTSGTAEVEAMPDLFGSPQAMPDLFGSPQGGTIDFMSQQQGFDDPFAQQFSQQQQDPFAQQFSNPQQDAFAQEFLPEPAPAYPTPEWYCHTTIGENLGPITVADLKPRWNHDVTQECCTQPLALTLDQILILTLTRVLNNVITLNQP